MAVHPPRRSDRVHSIPGEPQVREQGVLVPPMRVWISKGCIACHWCQHLVPEVFVGGPTGCLIRGTSREDGITDANDQQQVPLRPGAIDEPTANYLEFVAGGCPTKVIHVERR